MFKSSRGGTANKVKLTNLFVNELKGEFRRRGVAQLIARSVWDREVEGEKRHVVVSQGRSLDCERNQARRGRENFQSKFIVTKSFHF